MENKKLEMASLLLLIGGVISILNAFGIIISKVFLLISNQLVMNAAIDIGWMVIAIMFPLCIGIVGVVISRLVKQNVTIGYGVITLIISVLSFYVSNILIAVFYLVASIQLLIAIKNNKEKES